jgi:hypothetical protein
MANTEQIARAACGKADVADPQCIDVLLLLLTPDAYNSNNTADTPGGRAFISPAQVRCRIIIIMYQLSHSNIAIGPAPH